MTKTQEAGSAERAKAILLLKLIGDAIIESVKAAGPLGTPGGNLYAALMAHGISLEQYEQIMGGLVAGKQLEKRGELYFAR
jgi:hypothetical protein